MHFVFFELACAYGLKPGRPLLLLMGFLPVFACWYVWALRTTSKRTGIWVTYSADRTYKRRTTKREWRALIKHRPQKRPQNARTETDRRPARSLGRFVRLLLLRSRLRVLFRDQGGGVPFMTQVKPWLRT